MPAGQASRGSRTASLAAVLRRFARYFAAFGRSMRRRRELTRLLGTEDRMLADIGISRLDLIEALSAGPCRDPLPRLRRARLTRLRRSAS